MTSKISVFDDFKLIKDKCVCVCVCVCMAREGDVLKILITPS